MAAGRVAAPSAITLRIIWAAMLVAVAAFAVLVFVLPADAPPNPVFLPVFGMLAIADLALSFALPRFHEKRAFEKLRLEIVEEDDPDAEVLFRDQAPRRRVFADPATAHDAAMRSFGTATILRCALAINPALLGLVLHVTGGATEAAVPFFVLAVVALALHFPSDAKATGPIERHFGAKLVVRGAAARAA